MKKIEEFDKEIVRTSIEPKYILTKDELEALVQEARRAIMFERVDLNKVHPNSRARTFRRSVVRDFLVSLD